MDERINNILTMRYFVYLVSWYVHIDCFCGLYSVEELSAKEHLFAFQVESLLAG